MRQTYYYSAIHLIILICFPIVFGCNTSKEKVTKEETNSLFRSVSPEHSGISFSNKVVEKYDNFFEFFMYIYNGGGVSTGDINNDGLLDLYFTGNEIPNKLYLNKGNLKFEDITISANVQGDANWDNGVSMIDINGDGFLDIYVCRGGWQDTENDRKNLLYINQGDLTFEEQASHYGLNDTGYSMQATFFDLDNDNDLDVYLINRPDSFALPTSVMSERLSNPPEYSRDKLFVNNNGKFTEEGIKRGLGKNYGYGLSAVAADINDDGFADIFVSNDFSIEDYFYINQGDGTFKQQIKEATNHIALYSMGTDITDMNNDGMEDIVVMEMRPSDYTRSKISMPSMSVESFYDMLDKGMHKQYMHNMLYLNQGNTFFSEISQFSGISKTDWSWSVLSSDLDNDGVRDLFITNGMKRDLFDGDVQLRMSEYVNNNRDKFKTAQQLFDDGFSGIIDSYRPIKIRNYLFKNEGQLKFTDVSKAWGFETTSFSNGSAVADLDNDGDLDLIINNFDDPAFLFENTSNQSGNSITLDLNGPSTNSDGIGAKVTIFSNGKSQYFQNKTVRGYLSSSDPRIHFGLGQNTLVDSVIVKWNDGSISKLNAVNANQIVPINYSTAITIKSDEPDESPVMFATHSGKILDKPFVHKENVFNEYKRQILLPHMFSKSGPFISKGDINGDGKEDFFVGGASGQSGQLYIQKYGKLMSQTSSLFEKDKGFEDMGSALVDLDGDEDLDLVVVSGGSQFAEETSIYQDRVYFNDGKGNFTKRIFLPSTSSGSCVSPNDYDGDGDMDLFIGGHVVADKYLASPNSYIYTNSNGTFTDDTKKLSPEISKAGMINSATWVDINDDAIKELVIVGEWTPIQIFEFKNNAFTNISSSLGLDKTEGWWNKVIAQDLDKDGDMDLVLGNLGENYKFSASTEKPFEVFAGDFDNNGTNDVFLAKHDNSKLVPIRGKECTTDQMPIIGNKFPTFASFAYADLAQIIGSGIENTNHKEVYLLSSIILENDNGKLKIKKLPKEAQYSSVQGIQVEDFNDDGTLDILIAGNKFDVEVETTAADASPGYLLLGNENLEYEPVPPLKSGFFFPYNVKDIQTIDINGKTNILVGINDGELRISQKR